MSKRAQLPVALTIAGSDSGGGAGIQADLKTFAALGVHGTSAITCITAQNPKGVYGIQACSAEIVRRQIEAVFGELRPAAVKTGMLYSAAIIRVVAESLRRPQDVPLVVDPVMVSTSGAQLLKPAAVKALCAELLPLAARDNAKPGRSRDSGRGEAEFRGRTCARRPGNCIGASAARHWSRAGTCAG